MSAKNETHADAPVRLTGEAAFAAAVAAGVPCEVVSRGDGRYVMRTTQPVAVFVDGGLVKVFHATGRGQVECPTP